LIDFVKENWGAVIGQSANVYKHTSHACATMSVSVCLWWKCNGAL